MIRFVYPVCAVLIGFAVNSATLADETQRENEQKWIKWAKQTPSTGSLVVSVEFLEKYLLPKGKAKTAVTLHDAWIIANDMRKAASQGDDAEVAWVRERSKLESEFENGKLAAESELAWEKLFTAWEREVRRHGEGRFDDALYQASLIITGILLKHDAGDIEDTVTDLEEIEGDEHLVSHSYPRYGYQRARFEREREELAWEREQLEWERRHYEQERARYERKQDYYRDEWNRDRYHYSKHDGYEYDDNDRYDRSRPVVYYYQPCQPCFRPLRWLFCR